MPLIKRVHNRGANIVIEANAEVLFLPDGQIDRWTNSLSHKVMAAAAAAAPTNKRPRWAHYGKPLKASFKASSSINAVKMRAYSAVGSTAHYAAYVDQGTKSFDAKILPPWTRQSPSLYEHTFKVPENGGTNPDGTSNIQWNEIGKIRVSGQRAQHFFAKGLRVGMASMTVPGGGGPMMAEALASFPDRLADHVGATPWSFAFDVQLREWRAWRDAAWHSGKTLGQGYVRERHRRELRDVRSTIKKAAAREARAKKRAETAEQRRAYSAARSQRYRDKQRALKGLTKRDRLTTAERARRTKERSADRAKFLSAMVKKYGSGNVDRQSLEFRAGRWWVTVKVGRAFKVVSAPAKFTGAND